MSVAGFPEWALAFGASTVLAAAALVRGSLTLDGALAACLVGGTTWMGLGREGFVVLCVFFFTSTLLGRVGRARKKPLESHYSKGHRRDALQVMANGGAAFVCATALWLQDYMTPEPILGARLGEPLAIAACASLASANADTWATELGVLSRERPWHLLEWRRVAPGTSGAVSALGTGVALLGAATIAVAAFLLDAGMARYSAFTVMVLGFAGALFDSVLGATAQRQYRCTMCGEQVETPNHCGSLARPTGPAWARLDNDAVNFIANATAAIGAWFVAN